MAELVHASDSESEFCRFDPYFTITQRGVGQASPHPTFYFKGIKMELLTAILSDVPIFIWLLVFVFIVAQIISTSFDCYISYMKLKIMKMEIKGKN